MYGMRQKYMRDLIVKIFVRLGLYKPAVELINRVKFEIQARRMRKDGLAMLKAADEAFTQMGVRAFLTYGCLLGAYREHGFISYDPDIDLGVLAEEYPADMHARMANAGFRLLRQIYIRTTEQVVEETYEYKKLHLDVFIYTHEGNDYYRSYVPVSDFERRDFLGLNVYMPIDTDGWLRAIYSDSYMTPIKNWTAKGYKTRIVHTEERTYRRYY